MKAGVALSPAPSLPDDGSLVGAVLKGDDAAAGELFRRYHGRLVRRMRRWARDTGHAEDLAQDAWIRALRALDRFDGDAPLWPWLRSIADNVARSELRRSLTLDGRHRVVTMSDETLSRMPLAADAHARVDDAALLSAALGAIPSRQRDAFLAVAHEGKSTSVAAAELGLNENAFRQLYLRARRNLVGLVDARVVAAPLFWLQRSATRIRHVVRDPLGVTCSSSFQATTAAIGAAMTLVVVAPFLNPVAASAGGEIRDGRREAHHSAMPPGMDAASLAGAALKSGPPAPRGGERTGRRLVDTSAPPDPAAISASPPVAGLPEVRDERAPVYTEGGRAENPDVQLRVEVNAGPVRTEAGMESENSPARPAEAAVCEAAGAAPGVTCQTS